MGFMYSDKDLEDLKISPELRVHMGLVLHSIRRIFPIIYSEMERILNMPREQLVERARRINPKQAEKIVEEWLKQISMALDFLRSNQHEIHIVSIPIQRIWMPGNQAVFTTIDVPIPLPYFLRSPIYDVFPSQCLMLFHPVSFYVPESYLGSVIAYAIVTCTAYTYEEFDPHSFAKAMETLSEIARPRGIPDIQLDEKEARFLLSDLKRIGVLLVLERYLYNKILDTEYLSRLLLKKSIIESIPPIR